MTGAALCLACGFALGGCARNSSPNSNTQADAAAPALPQISKSEEQDWNRVLGQWWDVWQKSSPQKAPAPAAPSTPLVTINLDALAARHPAWKLASALEADQSATLDFDAIRAAGIEAQSLRAPSFDVNFGDENEADVSASTGDAAQSTLDAVFSAPGVARDAETVTAQGLEALQTEAADRQSDALENFLRAVAAREADARQQYAEIRRAALENEVEQTRSTPLPEVQTSLLSDEEQLQVTNLRLQLLRNIFSTEDERRIAREQLNEILSRWQARLRAQEKERLALLEERRVEAPRRVREEGEAQLRRELEKLQQEQRAAIRLVWQQHLLRVRQDFGNEDARLGIVLPAVSLSPQAIGGQSTPPSDGDAASSNNFNNRDFDFLETNFGLPTSIGAFSNSAAISTNPIAAGTLRTGLASAQRANTIRALRTQARSEARKQAQSAARRFGWRWQPASNRAVSAPDRTREVLQWLSG